MAGELVELMAASGHEHFAVVGHDRGARVAFRLALDHPERVTRLALLNIVPTVEQFERMAAGPSLGYWPWFLLAQPAPLPERIISADPDGLLEHVFESCSSSPDAIGPESNNAYRLALTPTTIASMCADHRASFHLDREHDAEDRAAKRSPPQCCPSSARTRPNSKTRPTSGAPGPRISPQRKYPAATSCPKKHLKSSQRPSSPS